MRKTLLSKAHGQYCRFAFHQATTRKQFHRFIVVGGFANGQHFTKPQQESNFIDLSFLVALQMARFSIGLFSQFWYIGYRFVTEIWRRKSDERKEFHRFIALQNGAARATKETKGGQQKIGDILL